MALTDRRRPCTHTVRHPHGSQRRYQQDRCRCYLCCAAHAQAAASYRSGGSWTEVDWAPSVGVRRRLQALACIGHTATAVAAETGMSKQYVSKIRSDVTHARIRVSTYRLVREVYDRLWDKPSTTPDGGRCATIALTAGWMPPLAWDDDTIDDPDATPDLGVESDELDEIAVQRYMAGTLRAAAMSRSPERLEAIRRLHLMGFSDSKIGDRVGMKRDAVTNARLRHRKEVA